MGRSKYPEKYDTSVEIPQIRGNINEIGVDVLNSIRSAILQIEHTLGVNPQGSATNTVSDRLSKSLDSGGNIKQEALDKAGVIYGPIINESIAKTAAIEEFKLKLDFPTRLLQTEVSLTMGKIDYLLNQFEEISSKFSSHVFTDTPNRHSSKSISIPEIVGGSSDLGLTSISSGSVYTAIEEILEKHVQYSGLNISSTNNSHSSEQIYFDNANVVSYITSENVQGAIEDLTIVAAGQQIDHQNYFHGNGYFNSSKISILAAETALALDVSVVFVTSTYLDSTRKTEISFSIPQEITSLERSDVVAINLTNGVANYIISDIIYNSSNEITKIIVFGSISESSTLASTATFYKRDKRDTSDWGLCPTVIEYPDLLSAGIVQIANPNSPGVISSNFTANSILLGSQFTLEINNKTYTIDCYNPGYSFQTLECIISAINESLMQQAAAALAYKVYSKKTGQYELAIISNFYGTDSYIKISDSTDSLILLGLSSWSDKTVYGTSGNYYLINGYVYSGIKNVMSLSGLTFDSGSNSISGSTFTDYQVKKGDIINISGSDQDDGSYIVINVSSSKIYVNTSQLSGGTWLSSSSSTTNFEILRNTISFQEYNFMEIDGSPNGSVFELFLDKNYNFTYRTKLEYEMAFYSGKSLFSIIDCGQVNSKVSEQLTFEYDGSNVFCYLNVLDKKLISNYKNTYLDIFSKNHNLFIRIMIYDADDIASYITSLGAGDTFVSNLYIYSKSEYSDILLLGNVTYSSANGRIQGSSFRLPYIYDLKDSGTIKSKDIGEEVRRDLQITPMKETRSSGVVVGLEILNVSFTLSPTYLVSIAPGVAYIRGKRFEFNEKVDFETGISSTSFDKIILFINSDGILFADSADSATCNFYINSSDNIALGTIEYNASVTQIIDQRLLINDLDLKLLNSVTVSPVQGMGHFTSVNSAIKYAKRFSQLYPEAGIPEVILKAGTHRIEVDIPLNFSAKTTSDIIKYYDKYGLYLDFPIKITGEGSSTILDIITGYTDYPISGDDRSSNAKNKGYLVINGSGSTTYPDFSNDIFESENIKLSYFKIKNSTILYIDPRISNSSGLEKTFQKLEIDNLYFDWSNIIFDTAVFSDTKYYNNAAAFTPTLLNGLSSSKYGNFSIKNCIFDTCFIDFYNNAIEYQNIDISNNLFFSQNETTNSSAPSFLIKIYNESASALKDGCMYIGNGPYFHNSSAYLFYYLPFSHSNYLANYNAIRISNALRVGDGRVSLCNGSFNLVDGTLLSIEVASTGFVGDVYMEGGDLTVDGNGIFAALTTSGTINAANIESADILVSNELTIDGASLVIGGGSLSAINTTSVNIDATSTLVCNGNANFNNDTVFSGLTSFTDEVTFAGGLESTSNTNIVGATFSIENGGVTIDGSTFSLVNGTTFSVETSSPIDLNGVLISSIGSLNCEAGAFVADTGSFTGSLTVGNDLSVGNDLDIGNDLNCSGSKSFRITHPHPEKNDWYLQHSVVETNTAGDNLYRWTIYCKKEEKNIIDLPDYYQYLNGNEMIWVSPEDCFGRGYGKKEKNKNLLEIYVDTDGSYNVLLVCTRIDPGIAKWKGVEFKKEDSK